MLTFPSWYQFTAGLKKFEENINTRRLEFGHKTRDFLDRHSTFDKILSSSLPFLPAPFNEIARAIYETIQVPDKEIGIQQVLSRLKSIESQGEKNYHELVPKLDFLTSKIIDMDNTVAKQQSLIDIQEILVSGFGRTNEKIDRLEERIVNLQNSFENATIKFGKLLNKLDMIYPEVVATIENKPINPAYRPRVIAQMEDNQVVFRSTKTNDEELQRITMNDLKSVMNPRQLLIFEAYESSLEKNLEDWAATKGEGKLDTDPEMREIAKRVCSNWGEIIELIGQIRYKLEDHYEDLLTFCHNSGMLIDKTGYS